MAKKKTITDVTAELYELLEPLEEADRGKVIQAVGALLGASFPANPLRPVSSKAKLNSCDAQEPLPQESLPPKAEKWLRQHKVDRSCLDELFHIDGEVELIASDVPGRSRRAKTVNCYLLVGIRALLETGESDFQDKDAVEYCQRVGAYDSNNHTSFRNSLGKKVKGNRESGFTLTVPGQREAAKLISTMATDTAS